MKLSVVAALAGLACAACVACADASYDTTTQITGGQFVDALRNMPLVGRQMEKSLAPMTRTVMVRGNQRAELGKDATDIVDLDRGEMIHIDHVRKTYSVITFEQMRRAAQTAMQQVDSAPQSQQPAQQPTTDIQMSVTTDVKNTGVTKIVNGLSAQEQVVTMTMVATDPHPQPGQPSTATFVVTSDAWIAPDPPEVKEVQEFDVRMAKKMMAGVDLQAMRARMTAGAGSMGAMFNGHPGSAEAMQQMAREMAKIQGTRVMVVTSMGGDVPAGSATGQPAPAPDSGAVAHDAAADAASTQTSRLGSLGGSLANSALGVFRRKKPAEPAPAPPPAAAAATTTPGATQRVTLMQMTEQRANFSRASVPPSAFAIPAGYAQVASPMAR